jgi:hypothetical protein
MRRVQAAQLQHHEEQEEDDGSARVQQVLPFLPEAHGAQGDQIESSKFNGQSSLTFALRPCK